MIQLRDKHRGHAVEGGTLGVLNRLEGGQRIKRFGRDNHGTPVDRAYQCSEDAAETMIERDGNADAVSLRGVQLLGQVENVHEQLALGHHSAFEEAEAGGSVLNIDDVIGIDFRVAVRKLCTSEL